MKAQLLDPESAIFTDIETPIGGFGSTQVCGKVNAKNSFGGYVGAVSFYVWVTKDGIRKPQIDSSQSNIAELLCFRAMK